MPRSRHSPALEEAHQVARDLRNQLHLVEQPLRERIRELEVERDRYVQIAKDSAARVEHLEAGATAALALVRWLVSSGKTL